MSTSNCPHLGPDTLSMITKESAEPLAMTSVLPHIPTEGREGESVEPGLMGLARDLSQFPTMEAGAISYPKLVCGTSRESLVEMNESQEGKVVSHSLA